MVTKALTLEDRDQISVLVRSGFYENEQIIEILCEQMYEPGELDPGEVDAAINFELEKLAAEKKTWPAVTDYDRLNAAFDRLSNCGIIALHNAGYTQSDGHDDFVAEYSSHEDKSSVVGYCFYHRQDLERAVRGGGLFVAFGPVHPNDEATKGPLVGKIIRDELERAGLAVEWDGTFQQRIYLPKFVWQRR